MFYRARLYMKQQHMVSFLSLKTKIISLSKLLISVIIRRNNNYEGGVVKFNSVVLLIDGKEIMNAII